MSNSKSVGNSYERKIAKLLNKWIFDDKIILKRASDSGALKDMYTGDIVPYGQLPVIWKGVFPFHIETKHGYGKDIPTPFKYETLIKWIKKSYNESKIHNQKNIIVIVQYPHQQNLIFINKNFKQIPYILSYNINVEGSKYLPFYCYKLKDLLEFEFISLFDKEFKC